MSEKKYEHAQCHCSGHLYWRHEAARLTRELDEVRTGLQHDCQEAIEQAVSSWRGRAEKAEARLARVHAAVERAPALHYGGPWLDELFSVFSEDT